MVKALKVWLLKRKLRFHYQYITGSLEQLDCGIKLAVTIRPSINEHIKKMNSILDRLETLGEPVQGLKIEI